jgi:hypothetical protein
LYAFSGYDLPQRFVVRDSATMAFVWETIFTGVSPRPDMPTIDFSRYMVLVAALGARSTSGYDILLDSAASTADGLVVTVRIVSPGNRNVLQVITRPVDVGVVPRLPGPVAFNDTFN